MEMEYKNLRIEEYDRIFEVWKLAGLLTRPTGRDSLHSIRAQMDANPEYFIGAYDGDKLIGLVVASDDRRKGWINRLAVIPEYRHRGVAKVLIRKAEQALFNEGIKIISCLIYKDNVPSATLFASQGYDISYDVLYLRKPLADDI